MNRYYKAASKAVSDTKDLTDLCELYNGALADMQEGEIDKAREKYLYAVQKLQIIYRKHREEGPWLNMALDIVDSLIREIQNNS